MRTSTCPAAGFGVGTSSSFRTSGPPNSRTKMAFMQLFLRGRPRRDKPLTPRPAAGEKVRSALGLPRQKLQRRSFMALRIGEEAPNFTAQTTEGPIDFHKWIGNQWAILFSHPKDFTPVCTTELGYMARIKPEFEKRNTKIMGLSVDSVDDHKKWSKDIEETQGTAPNYPM